MIGRILSTIALVAVAASAAAAADDGPPLGTPIVCHAAGVTVSLPQGYTLLVPEAANPQTLWPVLLQARKTLGSNASGVLWLEAHLLGEGESLDAAAARLDKAMTDSQRYPGLKISARPKIQAGDIDGLGRLYSFHAGALPAWAARIYFVFQFDKPTAQRICYSLTVAAPSPHQGAIVPDLRAVATAIRQTDLQPLSAGSGQPEVTFRSATGGFALAVPAGWYALANPNGVTFRQLEFASGGNPIDVAEVNVVEAPAGADEKLMADAAERNLRQIGRLRYNLETWRIHPAEMKLGKLAAHELVLQQLPQAGKQPQGDPGAAIPPRRCVALRAAIAQFGRRRYTYLLTAYLPGDDALPVKKRIQDLAATFVTAEPIGLPERAAAPDPPETNVAPVVIPTPVAPKPAAPEPEPLVIPKAPPAAPREAPFPAVRPQQGTSPLQPASQVGVRQPLVHVAPVEPPEPRPAPAPERPLIPMDLPNDAPPQARVIIQRPPRPVDNAHSAEINWPVRVTPKEASPVVRKPREAAAEPAPAAAGAALKPANKNQPVQPVLNAATPPGQRSEPIRKLAPAKGQLPEAPQPQKDLPIFEQPQPRPKVTVESVIVTEEPPAKPAPKPAREIVPDPTPEAPQPVKASGQLKLDIQAKQTNQPPAAPPGQSGTLQLGIEVKQAPAKPAGPQVTPQPPGAAGKTRPIPIKPPLEPGRANLPDADKTPAPQTQPAADKNTAPKKPPAKTPLEIHWD